MTAKSRTEAAAKAHYESGEFSEKWEMSQPAIRQFNLARMTDGIAAADAHDAANGVLRVSLSDATVERAARALDPHAWDETAFVPSAFRQLPEDARASRRDYARASARLVLAAAVKEDHE